MSAEKSTKSTSSSGRSTSPRAVERRRMQNRMSQQNRRRKIKETLLRAELEDMDEINDNTNTETDQREKLAPSQNLHLPSINPGVEDLSYIDYQDPTTSGHHSPPHDIMNTTMSDVTAQPPVSWLHTDPVMGMPMWTTPKESPIAQPGFAVSPCSCNGTTGPCPAHMEQIHAQALFRAVSPLRVQQQPSYHSSEVDLQAPFGSLPTTGSSYRPQKPDDSHQQLLFGSGFSDTSSGGSKINFSDGCSTALRPPSDEMSSPSSSSSRATKLLDPNTDTNDITKRFEGLLDAVRAAGFQDFDQMAVAYYTAQFKKNSVPASSQRASRSRRLKSVLRDLQDCSGQWPRRESRGLYEGLMETATSLCIEEMGRVDRSKIVDLQHVEPRKLLSTLGWLFFNHEHNMENGLEGLEGKEVPEEVRNLIEKMETAQDSMLHLWPFLTELAGPQGLFCDQIAQVALVILFYARQV